MSVKVTIISEKDLLAGITTQAKAALKAIGKKVVRDAKALCVVDPKSRHVRGKTKFPRIHTKDSIKSHLIRGKTKYYINVGTTSGRGLWLEKGTMWNIWRQFSTAPKPFLGPAVEKNQGYITEMIDKHMACDKIEAAIKKRVDRREAKKAS